MARWHGDDIRIDLARVEEVHVRTVGGEVAVTADLGDPYVAATVAAGPPIDVSLDGGVLTVRHDPRTRGRIGIGRIDASVVVRVPASTPVTVRTVSAEVTVAGFENGASLTTVSGPIVATQLSGSISFHTVSGTVEATGLDGDLHFDSISGAVAVVGSAGSVHGRSVSGDLMIDLEELDTGSLTTVSGEVMVRLPEAAAGRLDLTSMSGTIDCSFPVTGSSSRRRLSGLIGSTSVADDDAARLSARTVSGAISVLRQPSRAAANAGEGVLT